MKCENCRKEVKDEFMSRIIINKVKIVVCDQCKSKLGEIKNNK